jgi:glycosyltransferase involved in cell wall biosynthesis
MTQVFSRTSDIAWIVPAHNEAPTVGAVARAIVVAELGPVLVIADRCQDHTAAEALRAGAAVLLADAGDKGTALALGLKHTNSERVGFIDADLLGLAPAHLHQLAALPDAMVVGLRDTTRRVAGFPPIGGERVLPRVIARGVGLAGAGYRAEMELAAVAKFWRVPIVEVELRGLEHPTRIRLEREVVRWSGVWAGHRSYRRTAALCRPVNGRRPSYSAR